MTRPTKRTIIFVLLTDHRVAKQEMKTQWQFMLLMSRLRGACSGYIASFCPFETQTTSDKMLKKTPVPETQSIYYPQCICFHENNNSEMDACARFTIASILANLISLEMNPKWHWRTPMRSMNELMFKLPLSLCTQGSVRWQKLYYCAINAILRTPRLQKRIELVNTANFSIYWTHMRDLFPILKANINAVAGVGSFKLPFCEPIIPKEWEYVTLENLEC